MVNQWIYWVLFGVGLIEQESIRLLGFSGSQSRAVVDTAEWVHLESRINQVISCYIIVAKYLNFSQTSNLIRISMDFRIPNLEIK
jgi:hypothetical protein